MSGQSVESNSISNAVIAELLAQEGERATGHLQKALRRAARSAFVWPIEAADLLHAGRSLTELASVGPWIERLIRGWLEHPPKVAKPPAVRRNYLTMAQAGRLLTSKPRWNHFKGDLQMHSTWSDGAHSIRDLAEAAERRGYEFIAITDHSKGLRIAGGINENELRRQAEEISQANRALAQSGKQFRVLHGIELNLGPNGAGDMDSAALAKLDLVVGAFHSALRRTEDQTERYLAALRNPDIQILAHPRGRIYNHRLGLKADWERVFAEAARLDKAVEVDSYPDRQDLDIELLHLARDAGVRISIDTDAHNSTQLEFIKLGLVAALLSGIPAERIINFLPCEELLSWVSRVRAEAAIHRPPDRFCLIA